MFWLAFGHDGHLLAAASADDTVALWNVTDPGHPKQVASLPVQVSGAFGAAFSPDDRMLAVAGSDSTVRLWDVTDPARPTARGQLAGHTAAVDNAAFSPDGQVLATAGDDHTVVLTILDVGRARAWICAATGGNLDAGQWQRYVPGLPFDPPCS